MSLQSPLTVRAIAGGYETPLNVADLSFTKTARGGFESANFTVPEWVDSANPALGPVARIKIHDARTGDPVIEGYLDIAGKTVDRSGESWQVGMVGAQAVLSDRFRAYIGIDQQFDGWETSFSSNGSMSAGAGSSPADDTVDALVFSFGNGAVGSGSRVSLKYRRLVDSGQKVGAWDWAHTEGFSATGMQMETYATGGAVGTSDLDSQDFSTTRTDPVARSAGGTLLTQTDRNLLTCRMVRSGGATNVGSDIWWSAVDQMIVQALRKDQSGAVISGSGTYTNPYLTADQVVIDALRWFTNQIDVAGASIATGWTHHIDQLAYPDGIRLADLLDDLALVEPDMTWQVGASNAAGDHSFRLAKWPTTPRYEFDTIDGWSQPGGESPLCNSVPLTWTDRRGNPRNQTYTPSSFGLPPVAALTDIHRTRDTDPIDLGSEVGSQAAADRVAEGILGQVTTVPYAGTLTVARKVRDLTTGRMVSPWEIEPGYLGTVRGIGAPPLRITEMRYSVSDQSASLTLGTPTYSTEELIARLARRRRRGGNR